MSVIFPLAILGPEKAAPILWAPGIFGSFCWKAPHTHKIPRFRGGVGVFLERGGGVEVPILFYGHGDFSDFKQQERGLNLVGHVSDRFSDHSSHFSNPSSYQIKHFSGAISLCRP